MSESELLEKDEQDEEFMSLLSLWSRANGLAGCKWVDFYGNRLESLGAWTDRQGNWHAPLSKEQFT